MNYGEFKTLIAPYLGNNKEVLASLQSFVEMGERKIYRVLRVPSMEKLREFVPPEGSGGQSKFVIPADYLSVRSLTCAGEPLERVSDQRIQKLHAQQPGKTGQPKYFGRVAQEFWVHPFADSEDYTYNLLYYADRSGTLDKDADTTPMLRIAPDLLVYAIGYEVALRNRIPEDMERYTLAFREGIAELNEQASMAEVSGGPSYVAGVYGG
jgi:hypothetical protein